MAARPTTSRPIRQILRHTNNAIEVTGLTKRFAEVLAVDDLSFTVPEGTVTGFLGPNGAGKTTTRRMLLGLIKPTTGTATIFGRPFVELERPFEAGGASLEASSFHPGRRARDHLRVLATAAGIPLARVDELRAFLRSFADHGSTVLVSSHLLTEISLLVDDFVIVCHGRLVTQSSLAALSHHVTPTVRVRTPQRSSSARPAAWPRNGPIVISRPPTPGPRPGLPLSNASALP